MVERPTRTPNGDAPRGDDLAEWEVFVRSDRDDRLRHVGSVSAATPEAAHEHAARLFSWYASDVWICPAAAVHRFSAHELDESDAREDEPPNPENASLADDEYPTTDEGTDVPAGDADADADVEPRVREL
ncbi:MAG: Htur_1727 family rSAM-partnered candidate RiPP [Halopenitus sp.]